MADYPNPTAADEGMYADAEPDPQDTDRPEEEKEGEESTALLPTSFFMGKTLEPGSTCEVEIVRVHDDQVEVKYVPHEAENETEQPVEQSDPEMAELME